MTHEMTKKLTRPRAIKLAADMVFYLRQRQASLELHYLGTTNGRTLEQNLKLIQTHLTEMFLDISKLPPPYAEVAASPDEVDTQPTTGASSYEIVQGSLL